MRQPVASLSSEQEQHGDPPSALSSVFKPIAAACDENHSLSVSNPSSPLERSISQSEKHFAAAAAARWSQSLGVRPASRQIR